MTTKDFFQSVEQFNTAAGVMPAEGRTFNPRLVAFYTGMQCEELAEKLDAIFGHCPNEKFSEWAGGVLSDIEYMGERFKAGDFDDLVKGTSRTALLDADIDLQVVSEGAILASGADGSGARAEVCRSNGSKLLGGVIRDPVTSKVMKGPNYSPPDLAPYVCKSQGAQP